MKRTDKMMVMGMIAGAVDRVGLAKRAAMGDAAAVAFLEKHGQTIASALDSATTALENAYKILEGIK